MSGWAQHDRPPQVHGPFVTDMIPPGGVLATDMPMARPPARRRRIKGVPSPADGPDSDHQPGGGTWRDA